jgi:hypothetical protein
MNTPRIEILASMFFATAVFFTLSPRQLFSAELPVDVELVLAADASGSIDSEERRLQRRGYAEALIHPRVLQAVRGSYNQAIAVTYVEWSGVGCQRIKVPWARIHDEASARTFAADLMNAPPIDCGGANAIGDAIDFSAHLIGTNDFSATRRIIDVSGDGPDNRGGPVGLARDRAVLSGITINGLAIINSGRTFGGPGGISLDEHYRRDVTGGQGSFVLVVRQDESTFAAAILNKLVLEISDKNLRSTHKRFANSSR